MTVHAPAPHDVDAVGERLQQARDLLRRVLQVGVERDDHVAPRALHAREHGGVLAVVAVEPDHTDGRILMMQRAQDVRRSVAAPVVDEDHLVRLRDPLQREREAMVQVDEARRFVEHGHHDRQGGPRCVAQRSISRTSRQSLWPPKPNEFEMAARMRAGAGTLGT